MSEVTAEDLKRDLLADMDTCRFPTAAPWTLGDAPHFSVTDGEGTPVEKSWFCRNAVFIAASREGWPAAIRRALAAEADAAQLRETVHAMEIENHTLRQELSQTAGKE